MNSKPLAHLVNIICSTKNHHPNFVLFLGAGASVESGVKTSSQMINDWQKMMFDMYKKGESSIEEYLKNQSWFNSNEEYSYLFEKLFDEPSQRREYIETCIGDAYPSWGYIYLVNLLKNNVFNTIFTTNFDDLINEACYAFSNNIRPIVCAHDSSIKSLRITSKRPKIIKLHGDFLFDNLKNTVRELETLESNMLEKFKQYASEFGFIFVGYSGKDRSIMDTLNVLLKSESNFPHGIYWCKRKGSSLCDSVNNLSKYSKVNIVDIDGFDELFAEFNSKLNFTLQQEMLDPYKALTDKLNTLLGNIKLNEDEINPIIKNDIIHLAEKIDNTANIKVEHDDICLKVDEKSELMLPMPYILLAEISERNKNYKLAKKYIEKDLEKGITISNYTIAIKVYTNLKEYDKLNKIIDEIIQRPEILKNKPESIFDGFIILMNNNMIDIANNLITNIYKYATKNGYNQNYEYFMLNILQVKAHKKEEYNDTELQCLNEISNLSKDDYAIVGAYILLKNYDKAEYILSKIKLQTSIKHLNTWPIISLLKPHLKNKNIFN